MYSNKNSLLMISIALLIMVPITAIVYHYVWHSETYSVTDSGFSSISGIDGDLIVDHSQTAYAGITNSRTTESQGNVTVNIVWASDHSLVTNIYPKTTITIPPGSTWTMPNQTWTPTETGNYQVEVIFDEFFRDH